MATYNKKEAFLLYTHFYESISNLTLVQKGRLLDYIFLFAREEQFEIKDPVVAMAFSFIKERMEYNANKYAEVVEKRRRAGQSHRGNQYTQNKEQMEQVFQNGTDNVNVTDIVNESGIVNESYIEPITNVTGKDIEKKRKAIAYPYDEVVSLWNEICSPLPQVKRLNDSRRNKIKSRLLEFSKNSEEWLPKARELFERVVASDFLRGEKSDWQATFDWLFDNSKNWVKVVEGNYDNERKRTTQHPNCKLGVGEFIAQDGTRRYGTGNLPPVPMDAPPRPDDYSLWSRETNTWIPYGV